MTTLEFIGLLACGVLLSQLFERFAAPLLDIVVGRSSNNFAKESTILQNELYELQEQNQPINSNLIGFQVPDEEYYEEEEDY